MGQLNYNDPFICIVGSPNVEEREASYQSARQISWCLGEMNFNVITGGGYGIMEAACRGANDASMISVGLNTDPDTVVGSNPYVDESLNHLDMDSRRRILADSSLGVVILTSDFDRFHSLIRMLPLTDCGMFAKIPIVVFGIDADVDVQNLTEKMLELGLVGEEHDGLLMFTNSVQEAVHHIKKKVVIPMSFLQELLTPWWLKILISLFRS